MLSAAVCLAFLVPATVAAGYFLLLTSVGWPPPRGKKPINPRARFTVVIPAHDEELSLPAALASVTAADYPADLVRVLVVADNCTDRTAEVARRAGADVLERFDAELRGKGYALAAGLPRAVAGLPDAVLVLDADCELAPASLRVLDAEFRAGGEVIQAAYCTANTGGPTGLVASVGSEIENGVQAGLTALGRPVWLRGTGMAFRRDVVERFPWQAFGLTEDVEYAARLREGGVRIRFCQAAVVRCQPPPGTHALCQQRRRWRAALFAGGKGRLDRAVESKPLVLGHLILTLGFAIALGGMWAVIWALGLLLATAAVYGRAIRRVGGSSGGDFWKVPGVVARLAWVTAGGVVRRDGVWERTIRVGTSRDRQGAFPNAP